MKKNERTITHKKISGSANSKWEETYFVPVCFILYNLCDYIGKEAATKLQWPKQSNLGQYIVLLMAISRIAFIPLFMYCNVAPLNRSTQVNILSSFINVISSE